MKYSPILAIAVALFAAMSCSKPKTVTTENGVVINYVKEGTDSTLQAGQFLFINLRFTSSEGKELWNTDSMDAPMSFRYSEEDWKNSGLFFEALSGLVKGDSVNFEIDAEDFYTKTFGAAAVPDSVPSPSKLKFELGIQDVMDEEGYQAYMQGMRLKMIAKQYEEDTETFKEKIESEKPAMMEYAEAAGLDLKFTENGLGYAITQEGEGVNAQPGDNVVAHYTGYLLDGTKFDSSVDRGEPFSFPLGMARVIRGWDEGFALLNPGSKATLIIPSSFAYGENGAGADIGPNSILRFDVELIEVQ